MIVVDVGCQPHGREESVYTLADRFTPHLIYGFDPHPDLREGVELYLTRPDAGDANGINATTIIRRRAAGWIDNTRVPYIEAGIVSGVELRPRAYRASEVVRVQAVDVAAVLAALPEPLILKLDCEGAEYPILRRVRAMGQDERLELVLVEWHPDATAHGHRTRKPRLRCPVEEWG